MRKLLVASLAITVFIAGCISSSTVKIFHAGSLERPFHDFETEFEKQHPNINVVREAHGSREAVRQVTDLHREGDILAVSDYTVIENLMFPEYTDWYIIFARNEMVVAYTNRSHYKDKITVDNWHQILTRKDVRFGRSDPDIDPSGYRTLMVWQLANMYYNTTINDQEIYEALLEKCPTPTRPKESDLIALLENGQLDYAFLYRSLATQHNLQFVNLPPEIDLSSHNYTDHYAKARVTLADGTVKKGKPIQYAVTISKTTVNPDIAIKLVQLLLSQKGREIISKNGQLPVYPARTNNINSVPESLQKYVEEM